MLELREVDKPVPAGDEVLLKVRAVSLNKADWYQLHPALVMRPLLGKNALKPERDIIGTDVAGVVEAVGKDVTRFRQGDEVFGAGRRTLAEHAVARERHLVPKPTNVSFEEAAAVPIAGLTALQGLRKGGTRAGEKVLVDGASGGVGTFALQIAKSFGADVTAVCSTQNVDAARSMGADEVIDYTKEDFTRNGKKYDLVFGVNGYHSIFGYRRALGPEGRYLMAGSHRVLMLIVQMLLLGGLVSRLGRRKLGFMGVAKFNQENLAALQALLETGKVKPFVDKRFQLSETAEAFRYLGEGHARGKVVVSIS